MEGYIKIGNIKGQTGTGLTIKEFYSTVDELHEAVPNPSVGDAYGVGGEPPYDVYIYSASKGWVNSGSLQPDVNDQAPTYAEATTLETLTSGEKISIAFGKIATAIKEFIFHLSNNLAHNKATQGGAIGLDASATYGGAVGYHSKSSTGAAIGSWAESAQGAAIGYYAKTSSGAAMGYNAKTINQDGNAIDAVQLGTGTNQTPKTVQAYDYTLMKADGTIPDERTPNKPTVVTGSYVGVGDYPNAKSLTIDTPHNVQVLIITDNSPSKIGDSLNYLTGTTAIFTRPNKYALVNFNVCNCTYDLTWGKNEVSWLCERRYVPSTDSWIEGTNNELQFDVSGRTYNYIALCW